MEKDGKTKIYNSYNNKLIFEGYYYNGKREGYGEEYNDDGKLIFEGDIFKNGKEKKRYIMKMIN